MTAAVGFVEQQLREKTEADTSRLTELKAKLEAQNKRLDTDISSFAPGPPAMPEPDPPAMPRGPKTRPTTEPLLTVGSPVEAQQLKEGRHAARQAHEDTSRRADASFLLKKAPETGPVTDIAGKQKAAETWASEFFQPTAGSQQALLLAEGAGEVEALQREKEEKARNAKITTAIKTPGVGSMDILRAVDPGLRL